MSADPLGSQRLAAKELQLEAAGRSQPAYFHGLTMLPLLVEGDLVTVEAVEGPDVRVGDVVTYRYEEKFPTRRVIRIDTDERILHIFGDAVDGHYRVDFDDVLARVVSRRRGERVLRADSWRWRYYAYRGRIRAWLIEHRISGRIRWKLRQVRSLFARA